PIDRPPTVAWTTSIPDTITIGSTFDLSWTSADDHGVISTELRISRGGAAGPFELIASGAISPSRYTWTVTGPPAAQAIFQITARDIAGNSATARTAPFAIASPVDQPPTVRWTGTLPETLLIGRTLELPWSASDDHAVSDVEIRLSRAGNTGPFETLAS